MTNTTMNLQELLEKTTDPDFLREMIGFTAQRLMELEVETRTGAAPGVRSPERLNQRNAIGTGTGIPEPEPSSSASRSCARAAIFPASSNRAGCRRRL
jgi:Transposase, Mutator family